MFFALSPEIHHQLLGLVDAEWEVVLLIPFSQGTHLSVGRLIIVSDQAYHCCVISKFDDDCWSCMWLYNHVCTGSTGVGWGYSPEEHQCWGQCWCIALLSTVLIAAIAELQNPGGTAEWLSYSSPIVHWLNCCEKRTDEHEQSSWWTEHVYLQRKPKKRFKRHLLADSESGSHSARLLVVSCRFFLCIVSQNWSKTIRFLLQILKWHILI